MHNLQKIIEQKITWLQIIVKNAYNIINSIIIYIITVQLLANVEIVYHQKNPHLFLNF